MSNLSCKILGTTFSNPIWLGSGTITENKERVDKFLESKAGAIVPRTTRLECAFNQKSHPSYHLDINKKEKWMRNCEWTGNIIDYWRESLEELSQTNRVIMSVSGRNIEGLGCFIEIESQDDNDINKNKFKKFMKKLNIKESQIMHKGYVTMLLIKNNSPYSKYIVN